MKIAVVGIGALFLKEKPYIEKEYHIVAVADNQKAGEIVAGQMCVAVNELKKEEYDKVLICSKRYAEVLEVQLRKLGIKKEKIIKISDIMRELHYKHDIKKYNVDKEEYKKQYYNRNNNMFMLEKQYERPMLGDYRDTAGNMDKHYYFMDILVAKHVISRCPERHYDIGSRIDGFISHLLTADIPITIIDIRPMPTYGSGAGIIPLEYIQADATNLETISDNTITSLSSLHAVEHFGLGRYGDAIDTEACFKAMRAMQRVLAEQGMLYFAVPVGKENRLYFNAHRVFDPRTVLENFGKLELQKFYLIHEMDIFEYEKEDFEKGEYDHIIGDYDCGIFIFCKTKGI